MYGKHLGKPLQPLTLTTKQARFPGAYAVAILSPNIGAIKIRLVVCVCVFFFFFFFLGGGGGDVILQTDLYRFY